MVQLLLEHGATVNAHDKRGRRALHLAASQNRERVIRLLLDKNADVNVGDKKVSSGVCRALQRWTLQQLRLRQLRRE